MPLKTPSYEIDRRPFRDTLRAWMELNGYTLEEAADALAVPVTTYRGWLYGGRPCRYERTFRRLMTLLDAAHG